MERINRTFLGGVLKHRVCADIGAIVCAVFDSASWTVQPAISIYQSDAARRKSCP